MQTALKLACIVWLSMAGIARAQIQILAVVNSASYQAGIPELGGFATIFCTGLTGIAGVVSPATQSPLPLQLAGVLVTVNLGAAPLLAVADLGGGIQQIDPAHAGDLIAVYGTGFGPPYPPKPRAVIPLATRLH